VVSIPSIILLKYRNAFIILRFLFIMVLTGPLSEREASGLKVLRVVRAVDRAGIRNGTYTSNPTGMVYEAFECSVFDLILGEDVTLGGMLGHMERTGNIGVNKNTGRYELLRKGQDALDRMYDRKRRFGVAV
jgi:hypothetical protein